MNCERSYNHVIKLNYLELLRCFHIFLILNTLLSIIFALPYLLALKIFWIFPSFLKSPLNYHSRMKLFSLCPPLVQSAYFYHVSDRILLASIQILAYLSKLTLIQERAKFCSAHLFWIPLHSQILFLYGNSTVLSR